MSSYRAKLFITLTLFPTAWGAAVIDHGNIPGGRIVKTTKSPLKPLLNHLDAIRGGKKETRSILPGLLEVRRSFCPSGYGQCPLGVCCPLNGGCCPNGVCCGHGQRCCSVGCCDPSDYCVVDSTTGRPGCCPLGEVCSDTSDTCEDSGFFPCKDDDFCCPSGNICFRDGNNIPRCRVVGSNPDPTTHQATTFRSTSTKSLSITRTGSTESSSTESSIFITSTPTFLNPTVYPVPSSGTQNIIVDVTDSRVTWSKESWTLGPSTCNSTGQSIKTTTAQSSLSFMVDSATSVYFTLSARNVLYSITTVEFYTRTPPPPPIPKTFIGNMTFDDCKLVWSSGSIPGRTEITITVGGSAISLGDEQTNDWSLEFHNFLIEPPHVALESVAKRNARPAVYMSFSIPIAFFLLRFVL